MKKFLLKIIFLLPIPLIVIAVNFFVDPASLYRNRGYEAAIAQLLLSGENVAHGQGYFDDRLLQRYCIEGFSKKKKVILLGSSRSMTIGSNLFPGKAFFNNGICYGRLEDYMAIYWMYRKRGLLPDTVIICLDPWLLNRNNGIMMNNAIKDDYRQISEYLSMPSKKRKKQWLFSRIPRRYFELFSPAYFQASLLMTYKKINGTAIQKDYYYPTRNFSEEDQVKHADGSVSFFKKLRMRTLADVEGLVNTHINRDSASYLMNFRELDADSLRRLDKFSDLMLEDNVELVFLLLPYHPKMLSFMSSSSKFSIILEAQETFKELAKGKKIRVIGSYNPDDCGFGEADFYDDMHPKKESLDKYLSLAYAPGEGGD